MSNTLDFDALGADLETAASQRYHIYFLGSPMGSPMDSPRTDPIGFGLCAKDFVDTLSWVQSEEVGNDAANCQIFFTDPNPGASLIGASCVYQLSTEMYSRLLSHVMAAPIRHCL
jgi:hypothetical protein